MRTVYMEKRAEFLKKLNSLVALAHEHGDQITIDEVKSYFTEAELTGEQMELVFDYLLTQKVVVKGYFKMQKEDSEQAQQDGDAYTEEEKAYLAEYMKDLEAFRPADGAERQVLFGKVMQGDAKARQRLTELYLKEVVEIAKDMYHPEIFLGDLIQEGNLGLILGMDILSDEESAHDTIINQVRQSIQMLIEEHAELSGRDKKMVEKVQLLDESITQLTEELGRKVTIDELSVYMGMTEDEINDILRLTGEEPEEEHDHDGHTHKNEEEA